MQTQALKLKHGGLQIPEKRIPSISLTLPKEIKEKIERKTDAISRKIIHPTAKLIIAAKEKIIAADARLLRYTKIERYIIRSVAIIIAIDILLGFFLVIKSFTPLSSTDRAVLTSYLGPNGTALHAGTDSSVAETSLGSGTANLITEMKKEGFNVSPVGVTSKQGMSVPGQIISIDGETLLAFEYANSESAGREANMLASSYSQKTKTSIWDVRTHIYQSGSVVLFYLGTNDAITQKLTSYAGISLINQKIETVALQ